MLSNLLTDVSKTRTPPIGEAALYALLGFLVVFVGIAILILIVWAVGKIMMQVNLKQAQAKEAKSVSKEAETPIAVSNRDEISEETVAAITAAIMAYYQNVQPKCEFTVKRIKKV